MLHIKEIRLIKNQHAREKKYHLWGWALFVISSFFFIAASIQAKDMTGLLGGVFFLAGCLFFLVPYLFPDS